MAVSPCNTVLIPSLSRTDAKTDHIWKALLNNFWVSSYTLGFDSFSWTPTIPATLYSTVNSTTRYGVLLQWPSYEWTHSRI